MRKAIAVLSAVILLALTGCGKSGVYSNGEGESIFAPDPPKSASRQSSSSVPEDEPPKSSSSSSTASVTEEKPMTDIGSRGETINIYGEPAETLAEFNYDRLYEQRKAAVGNGGMKALGELLDSLGKPEVKELYIRALAVTDGFANDGYLLDGGAHICVKGDNWSYYDETGFSYRSFTDTLKGIFAEGTVEGMLENAPYMYRYRDALWQGGITPPCYNMHTEYELVQNLDNIVEFISIIYVMDDITETFDPSKRETYTKKTISNYIIKTEDGWQVVDMAMFGCCSAMTGADTEDVIDIDFLKVPDGAKWLPLYTQTEAHANGKALFARDTGDQSADSAIQSLVNRNILAFDIIHGRGWETVGEPLDGASVYEISSEYFSTLGELNEFFYGIYIKETADEILAPKGTSVFFERDGKLCVDTKRIPIWVTYPFTHKTYVEPTSISSDKYVFKWHYVYSDCEVRARADEMTFVIEQTDGGPRLVNPVFDNPALDMSGE